MSDNPLLQPWQGPYGGVPPFDAVSVELLGPALQAGMTTHLAELDAIANDPAAPNFANTIAAMERSGRALDRVSTLYYIHCSSLSNAAVQELERTIEPKLAAFRDAITQNEKLFARIAKVYAERDRANLDAEQQRLTWLIYTDFLRAGAQLDKPAKARLAEINQSLATLYTRFSQNLLADESDIFMLLDSAADLAGLPASLQSALAAEAERRNQPGKWVVANTRSSVEPFLTYSSRRDLRERAWRQFVDRGDNAGARDNKPLIAEMLQLRAERARLLGHETHAHWRLENSMAKTPQRALELMLAVWRPAVERAREEIADMQALADTQGEGVRIAAHDYRYYAEQIRKAKFDLDTTQLKPYLQLEKLREGMFHVAGELFDLHFVELAAGEVPVYHPDVRVWRVERADGSLVGLFYFDPYARIGKQSGAWMSAYRNQERFDGIVSTIVSNNSNFVKAQADEAVLVNWDDAVTLFHEFGHALHGLCSAVNYPTLAGTNVVRDYVEFPSQLLEHWLPTRQILGKFAVHHQTGEPLASEWLDKLERAKTFNQGFATVEYLAAALLDMRLHLEATPAEKIDVAAREAAILSELGMPAEIVTRHRTPHFGHIFAGDGYSAGYYSYLWADTLVADAWEAFTSAAGPWDRTWSQKLLAQVLSVGNTVDPAESFRRFLGRDPQIDALMRKRGFFDNELQHTHSQ